MGGPGSGRRKGGAKKQMYSSGDISKRLGINVKGGQFGLGGYSRGTVLKMAKANKAGYSIVAGNSPKKSSTKYGAKDFVKIAQVNSRKHGKSIRTVYGVKK